MDNLQYVKKILLTYFVNDASFKPYYKWITFNTYAGLAGTFNVIGVLNLIING